MEILFTEDDLEPGVSTEEEQAVERVKPAQPKKRIPTEPIWEEASLFGVELEPHHPVVLTPAEALVAARAQPIGPAAVGASAGLGAIAAPDRRFGVPLQSRVARSVASQNEYSLVLPKSSRSDKSKRLVQTFKTSGLKRNADGAFEEVDKDGRTIVRDEYTCRDPELLQSLRRRARSKRNAADGSDENDLTVIRDTLEEHFPDAPFAKSVPATDGKKKSTKSITARAVAMLARRDHSEKELRAKLALKLEPGESARDIETAIVRLREMGFLSDERFAKSRVRVRASRAGDGAIRRELRGLGLEREVIDAAMGEIEESEEVRCWRLWSRRFGELAKDRKERERQIRWLLSRGFSMGVVLRVVRGEVDYEGDTSSSRYFL